MNNMAQKKTYIYRMLIGHDGNTEVDIFMYARNSEIALSYCKEKYREQKYNYFKPIKVGLSHTLKETQIVSDYEAEKLKNSIASKGDKYSEKETEAPQFITKEEAGELGL